VGLRIASKTPAEIAVAIAGELIWVRNTLGDGEAARSAPQTSALQG
jgi:xanthine dehydrogenase accessory factor